MNNTDFCARARDLVIGALEGDVATELDRAFLDKHLAECANCRGYKQTMQHLAISLKGMEEIPVPAGLSDRIMGQIAEEAKVSGNRFHWKKTAPIAAAVLLVALAVPMMLNMTGGNPQGSQIAQQQAPYGPIPKPLPGPDGAQPLPGHDGQQLAMQPPPQGEFQPSYQSGAPSMSMPNQPMQGYQSSTPGQSAQRMAYQGQQPDGMNQAGPQGYRQGTSGQGQIQQAHPVDSGTLASAGVAGELGMDPSSTFASEQEEDLYYDPVSTLVGF